MLNVEWEYVIPDSMQTDSRGECQRLFNGNTIITTGQNGNLLEINQNNDIVWHLNIKNTTGLNSNLTIMRNERIENLYPFDFSIEFLNLHNVIDNNYLINANNNIEFKITNIGWLDNSIFINIYDNI